VGALSRLLDALDADNAWSAAGQGLTLYHCSAQLEPFLTQKYTLNTPNTPYHPLDTPESAPNCNPLSYRWRLS